MRTEAVTYTHWTRPGQEDQVIERLETLWERLRGRRPELHDEPFRAYHGAERRGGVVIVQTFTCNAHTDILRALEDPGVRPLMRELDALCTERRLAPAGAEICDTQLFPVAAAAEKSVAASR